MNPITMTSYIPGIETISQPRFVLFQLPNSCQTFQHETIASRVEIGYKCKRTIDSSHIILISFTISTLLTRYQTFFNLSYWKKDVVGGYILWLIAELSQNKKGKIEPDKTGRKKNVLFLENNDLDIGKWLSINTSKSWEIKPPKKQTSGNWNNISSCSLCLHLVSSLSWSPLPSNRPTYGHAFLILSHAFSSTKVSSHDNKKKTP